MENDRKNPTNSKTATSVIGAPASAKRPDKPLSQAQLDWIDYTATQGLITGPDGEMKKMTVKEFAQRVDYNPDTLYEWRKSIPNFWELVGQRCMDIFSETRTLKVINSIYLNATVKMNVQAQALWMANQRLVEFRQPNQEVKVTADDSWASIFQSRAKELSEPIEGEVISESDEAHA
jgi:hypothetical protein